MIKLEKTEVGVGLEHAIRGMRKSYEFMGSE